LNRWQAFLAICDCLCASLADRHPAHSNDDCDWPLLVRLANEQNVPTTLGFSLLSAATMPEPAREYFDALLSLNAARNAIIEDSVRSFLDAMESRRDGVILLKGVSNLLEGLYPHPGMRIIGDIDILVHPSLLDETVLTLNDLGYTRHDAEDGWWVPRPSHHLPPLIHRRTGVGIELHHELSLTRMGSLLATSRMFARAIERSWCGREFQVLAGTDRILHQIVHAQIHHEHHALGGTELRHLFDLALLAGRYPAEIDWDEVSHSFSVTGNAAVLESQAAQCASLLGRSLPVSYGDPHETLSRLKSTVMSGRSKRANARLLLSRYWRHFADHPQLALNLLDPRWWPGRIRNIMDQVKSG
jgi:hypothetical protein